MTLAAVAYQGLALGGSVGVALEALHFVKSRYNKVSDKLRTGSLTAISTIAFAAINILIHAFSLVSRNAFLGGLFGFSFACIGALDRQMTPLDFVGLTILGVLNGSCGSLAIGAFASWMATCLTHSLRERRRT